MQINLYSVNSDDSESIEALNVSLASCFPDDPDEMATVERKLQDHDVAYYGGGTAPLFKFVRLDH